MEDSQQGYDGFLNASRHNVSESNTTSEEEKLEFNNRMLVNVVTLSVIFVFGSVLNVAILCCSLQRHHRCAQNNQGRNNVHLMVAHLAISDLIVCAVIVPLEIGWRISVAWVAGNVACKILMYIRAFAYYLSSLTLVALSMDRYWAVSKPLSSLTNVQRKKGKIALLVVWAISVVLAIPQTVVFRVIQHPNIETFYQCTTIGYFEEVFILEIGPELIEKVYNGTFLLVVFYLPLVVIIITYAKIQLHIWGRKERDGRCVNVTQSQQHQAGNEVTLRRHCSIKRRPHNRALFMSVMHVLAFLCCWTPYAVATMWHIIDSPSITAQVSSMVQDAFSLLAVFNSCINPMVYGGFYFKSVHSKSQRRETPDVINNASRTRSTRRLSYRLANMSPREVEVGE